MNAMWVHLRTGIDRLVVPHTSLAPVVEARKVTRLVRGVNHALGVRSWFPRPFQKMPRNWSAPPGYPSSSVGSLLRYSAMDTVNVVYTGASLGRISCCRTSANRPSSASVPSRMSVGDSAVPLALPWTSNPPTQCLGTSSRLTCLMEGTCASQPAATTSSAINADTAQRLIVPPPRAPTECRSHQKKISEARRAKLAK